MSDDRKPIDLKYTKAALDALREKGGGTIDRELLEKATIADKPVFKIVDADPETGDLLGYELTPEMQEALSKRIKDTQNTLIEMADGDEKIAETARKALAKATAATENIRAAVKEIRDNVLTGDTIKQWRDILERARPVIDALDELQELTPYIEAELKKPEYNGVTLDELLNDIAPADLLDLPEDSTLFKAMQAARSTRDQLQAARQARETRQAQKEKAKQANAIMQIKGGNYPVFSKAELWDAFAPQRICKMGTLDPAFIDDKTGEIMKRDLQEGEEIMPLDALDVPLRALMLLNAVMGNSVDNYRQNFVKNGEITFYVKGVLQSITDDPRILTDNQLNMDRKTAGAVYLENLFKPLQGYIGTTENGSRWSVFNYIGYEALSDTMTVQTPYIYQLWRSTQEAYFDRQQRQIEAHADDRRPKKDDFKPLEINSLFKDKAYTADETTLEIAIYITNVLLTAGGRGRRKITEIQYTTLIKNCPRFRKRLQEIEARPNTEIMPDGKKRNNTAIYNTELRKIKSAFDLILDPEKCDALQYFDFIDIQPANVTKEGQIQFIPPTKKNIDGKTTEKRIGSTVYKINGKIFIEWSKKRRGDDLF